MLLLISPVLHLSTSLLTPFCSLPISPDSPLLLLFSLLWEEARRFPQKAALPLSVRTLMSAFQS